MGHPDARERRGRGPPADQRIGLLRTLDHKEIPVAVAHLFEHPRVYVQDHPRPLRRLVFELGAARLISAELAAPRGVVG